MLRATIATALLAVSGMAAAADDSKGLMLGIAAGQIDYDSVLDIDDTSTAWKAYAGYRFSPNFTTELAYVDGGEYGGELASGVHVSADVTVIQLSATGGWWFNDVFGAYVRAAWNNYDAKVRASAFGMTVSDDVNEDELGYGVGLQVLYDRSLVRLEYETADIEDSDVSVVFLNVGWQF
jgi:hypothetical protein